MLKSDFIKMEDNLDHSIISLSKEWAKKYVQELEFSELSSDSSKKQLAQELLSSLRSCSAYAWTKTENFLAHEVKRHQINHQLIDPWQISQDIHRIFETTLQAYQEETPVQRLSVLVSEDIGKIRSQYTNQDPRLIGFVTMQFHHTGEELLNLVPLSHQAELKEYFKVIDDHLYIPLQRMYNSAAHYHVNAIELSLVHELLPNVTQNATEICEGIIQKYPNHYCYSGYIASDKVRISSERDAEMFQIYLLTSETVPKINIKGSSRVS